MLHIDYGSFVKSQNKKIKNKIAKSWIQLSGCSFNFGIYLTYLIVAPVLQLGILDYYFNNI